MLPSRGAGWRADCFGDYGYFSPTWNHMEHAYPPVLEDPVIEACLEAGPRSNSKYAASCRTGMRKGSISTYFAKRAWSGMCRC